MSKITPSCLIGLFIIIIYRAWSDKKREPFFIELFSRENQTLDF